MRFTVKQARAYAGMTQEEMAKHLDIDRSTYIKIEKDISRATVGQINLIAQITGISLSDIFLGNDSTLVENKGG